MSDPRQPFEPNPPAGSSPPAAPGTPPEITEDSSAQALAEALRSSFAIVKVLMIGLLIAVPASGFFKVGSQEVAVILRFGVPVGGGEGKLLGPGAHWAFPAPIDKVILIPVGQVQKVDSTVGWYATTAAQEASGTEPPPEESLQPGRDGYLLTSDVNIIHAKATLRYRIAEPGLRYMLDFVNASNLVQNAFDNSLVYAAARYRVDDALTQDQAGFRELALSRFSQLAASYRLGITELQMDNVQLIPPRKLKEAFARVSEEEVRRGKAIDEARSFENETISKSRAEAEARVNGAQAEQGRLVELIAAEVERFTNNLPAYRANPTLFVQQRQAELQRAIYANAKEKVYTPAPRTGRTLFIKVNRVLPTPKTAEPAREAPQDKH